MRGAERGGRESTLRPMILSFGPSTAGSPTTALALGLPSFLALVGYAFAALPSERFAGSLRAALLVAWFAHAGALVVDVAGLGTDAVGARFGFAPALSITLWLVLAVCELEARFVPLPAARRILAALGVAVVLLAAVYPGQLHPQVSRWAPLHWLLGIASYGLFGVAVLHAAMLNRAERQMRRTPQLERGSADSMPLLRLERLTFRFVVAGFVVLSAAIVFGAWFASPWRWDQKPVFSLLGWCVFAGLLVGRFGFGWRGLKATRWLYTGALLLLLAYVGSRFVLEVLLQRPTA